MLRCECSSVCDAKRCDAARDRGVRCGGMRRSSLCDAMSDRGGRRRSAALSMTGLKVPLPAACALLFRDAGSVAADQLGRVLGPRIRGGASAEAPLQ